jgi:cytoskeletal protein RodZ
MTLWQRWKQTSLPNKLLVSASILMAFGTLFYSGVAIFQYRMMRDQSETTKGQLRAMQEQSNVMQRSLDTFREQSNTMKEQTNTLKDSLAETRKAANAAVAQANASMRQASASQVSARAAEISAKAAEKGTEISRQAMVAGNSPIISVTGVEWETFANGKSVWLRLNIGNAGNALAEISGAGRVVITKDATINFDYSKAIPFEHLIVLPKAGRMVTPFSR